MVEELINVNSLLTKTTIGLVGNMDNLSESRIRRFIGVVDHPNNISPVDKFLWEETCFSFGRNLGYRLPITTKLLNPQVLVDAIYVDRIRYLSMNRLQLDSTHIINSVNASKEDPNLLTTALLARRLQNHLNTLAYCVNRDWHRAPIDERQDIPTTNHEALKENLLIVFGILHEGFLLPPTRRYRL